MKKLFILLVLVTLFASTFSYAATRTRENEITPMTMVAGLCSLIVWPGIGQAVNTDTQDKVVSHAIFGIVDFITKIPVARVWSGYDALVNRRGGYLDGKI